MENNQSEKEKNRDVRTKDPFHIETDLSNNFKVSFLKKILLVETKINLIEELVFRHDETASYYPIEHKPTNVQGHLYFISLQKIPKLPKEILIGKKTNKLRRTGNTKPPFPVMLLIGKEFGDDNAHGWVSIEPQAKAILSEMLLDEIYPAMNKNIGDWLWMDIFSIKTAKQNGSSQ